MWLVLEMCRLILVLGRGRGPKKVPIIMEKETKPLDRFLEAGCGRNIGGEQSLTGQDGARDSMRTSGAEVHGDRTGAVSFSPRESK
jgi:hypothetical protein